MFGAGLPGGEQRSILYDNLKLAVARIRGEGTRRRTRIFSELQSHYLFADRFGRPGKGNDKGKVEGLVGYARRNFMVPIPRASSWEELNLHLEAACLKRWQHRLRGHREPATTSTCCASRSNWPAMSFSSSMNWATCLCPRAAPNYCSRPSVNA